MRFVADAMLGRLARWLRILGHDTLYDPSWDDAHLIRLTRAEDRILLTRDRELAKRSGASIMFIKPERLNEQLMQLQHELAVVQAEYVSRCPACNSPLQPVNKAEAWEQVPLYVFFDNVSFSRCLNCGRYYWPGTQWERIRNSLALILS